MLKTILTFGIITVAGISYGTLVLLMPLFNSTQTPNSLGVSVD